jgi:hypothetical protein
MNSFKYRAALMIAAEYRDQVNECTRLSFMIIMRRLWYSLWIRHQAAALQQRPAMLIQVPDDSYAKKKEDLYSRKE